MIHPSGRVLCLDYGRRRIGVSISDSMQLTAQPFETWTGLKGDALVQKITDLIKEKQIEKIVVGYPLTLAGNKGKSAEEVDQLMHVLEKTLTIPVLKWDERLSSVQAKRALWEMNQKPGRMKERIDLIASVFILQSYLDYQNNREDRTEEGQGGP